MSFSNTMKSDLCRVTPEHKCCLLSELTAMFKVNGVVYEENNCTSIMKLTTENVNVAKRMYSLIKDSFNVQPGVVIRKSKKLKEHNIFIVSLNINTCSSSESTSNKQGLVDLLRNRGQLKSQCCKKAYLRGVFLGAGSITNPNNCYHVEIVTKDYHLAQNIKSLLKRFHINAKATKRKNNYIVYIKEVDQICDFLNIIGAHKAMLDLENIRILKEMRNSVNRIVNCETANLSKVVDASLRHINSIKYLKEISELDKLPKSLREIAYLRLEYPDSSLKELGLMLEPSIGKSGVNHRLKKIDQIAEELHKLKEEHK